MFKGDRLRLVANSLPFSMLGQGNFQVGDLWYKYCPIEGSQAIDCFGDVLAHDKNSVAPPGIPRTTYRTDTCFSDTDTCLKNVRWQSVTMKIRRSQMPMMTFRKAKMELFQDHLGKKDMIVLATATMALHV